MSYQYTQINRLEEPHNYMYTPFQGEKLLRSYQSSRMAVVQRNVVAKHASVETDFMLAAYALPILEKLFDASSDAGGMKFRSLIEKMGGENRLAGQDRRQYPERLGKRLGWDVNPCAGNNIGFIA